MKFSHLLTLAIASSMFLASTAQAVVTVTHTSTATGTLTVGQSFSVDVVLGYDGTPTLTGVFVSAGWDPAQLQISSMTPPTAGPFAIFFGASGFLSKVSDPAVFPGDPAGTIRTIQYGANPGQSAGAGADVIITTLTFDVIGVGDGTADVDIVFNAGDILLGAAGAPLAPGDRILTDFSIAVPEPSSAVLAFSVLAALGLIHRVKMR